MYPTLECIQLWTHPLLEGYVRCLGQCGRIDRVWAWVLDQGEVTELRTEAFDTETPDDLIVYCSDTSVSGDSSSEFWLSNRDDYTFTLNEDLVHLASYHDSDGSHEELTFFTNQNLDKHSILVAEFLADFADVFEHEAAMARVFN